jgi:hypothetical protein
MSCSNYSLATEILFAKWYYFSPFYITKENNNILKDSSRNLELEEYISGLVVNFADFPAWSYGQK